MNAFGFGSFSFDAAARLLTETGASVHLTSKAVDLLALLASRRHARITIDGEAALIEDCGSRNGTWVSGERTTGRLRLKDGDDIAIAGLRMLFRIVSPGQGNEATE